MSRVLLLHPAFQGKFTGKPLGLVSVATALQRKGHTVRITDLNAQPAYIHDLRQSIAAWQPDFVGIASTSPTHLDACSLANMVKGVGNIPVIKGGTHETYCYETTLSRHPEIDFSVLGPGEDTICELIEVLETGKPLESVAGIAFRSDGRINITGQRRLNRDLDAYPHPDRSLLEPSAFYDFDMFQGDKTTQARMSRGCSYGCTFCPIDRTYVFNSAEYVVEELRQIAAQGYKAIFWDDAIFTARQKLVKEVLNTAIAEGIRFKMGAQTRPDVHLTQDLVSRMQRAGFVYLSLGLESGDPEVLAEYNKRLNVDAVEHAVHLLKDYGIRTAITAIIGAPTETLDSVRKTVDAINRIKPDAVSWSVYSIYPGSHLQFNPLWYEDPHLSREHFWQQFDEGFKAKHARDIEYVAQAWHVVRDHMDPTILF